MSRIANDILEDVSLHLIETVVDTSIALAVSSGSQTVIPGSMKGIYAGANLIIARGGANEEVVTVASITSADFTATFANSHTAGVAVNGATFSSGQTNHPLFTQAEMLGYLEDAQNDFLMNVRPVYNTDTKAISNGVRYYTQPAKAIRLESIAISGGSKKQLHNVSQSELDMEDPSWMSSVSPSPLPTKWFQDQINNERYGFKSLPQVNETAELWFSEKETVSLVLNTTLLLPDVFTHYLKYRVLEMAWSKDGEQRDPQRAEYCNRRYRMGLFVGKKFLEGIVVEPAHRQRSIGRPAPMAIPAGVG